MPSPGSPKSLIAIGVMVAGPLDFVDARAARMAVEQADQRLSELFEEFRFDFFEIRRPEMTGGSIAGNGRVEPSVLLQQAVEERDSRHWDFAIMLTASELVGNYSSFCFAALSRPLDAAVLSMSLIDPMALGVEANRDERVERIARRLSRLILHSIGHLSGLPQSSHPNDLMYHPPHAGALDLMAGMGTESVERQRMALAEIADQRLEEGAGRGLTKPMFALRAAWINRKEITQAIWAARPWEFPKRLSRLTIASFSTLAILFMTAEAWDLALGQGSVRLPTLLFVSLLATTFYVVLRQQLLVRRGTRRSEQAIVTSVSAMGIVFVGMATTWAALFVVGMVLSFFLFPSALIADWAASSISAPKDLTWSHRPQMAVFAASLGLMIGALGASFESQHYFRHIIFVDEEL
ncbi:hypothetical protein [Allorhodopirellula heiligendammensis]|uniref:Uncharacterized protein n=1 Tax=Allorhodopirellula heiligendammensis TaxID=2714739 RepID=A0A5C6B8K8_9BACT|nr:hypothetical protein [Allorhodopirellula heiligendammensis]TWU08595.1 hypothetical protein Poly21_55640 [Allorhodopirellula heiligendammensis]